MYPDPKHQPLFFTPRTPWGTRLTGRSFFDHLKASDTVPLTGPDEKHQLWGKELQSLGAQTATSKFEGSGGMQRTLDRVGVPRGLSAQITPQRAIGTDDHLAMFPPSAPPTSQRPQPKLTPRPPLNPPSGGGGQAPEPAQSEPAERSDGLVGQHFYFGGTGEKIHGEHFSGDVGLGYKTDSSSYVQPATTKEALDDYWEKMRGPRAPGVRFMK